MSVALASLYAQHLAQVLHDSDAALAASGHDSLLIAAGTPRLRFLDDQAPPFVASPHFLRWLPLTDTPGSWIVHVPGSKPRLIFLQPRDYWHVVPETPRGYWVEHFDIVTVADENAARLQLERVLGEHSAILGEEGAAGADLAPNNPPALLARLHWTRACKTPYEITLMRAASRIGARGHRAAARAFHAGASEFEIHIAYLATAGLSESELPYANIIGLDTHGSVLHYTRLERARPQSRRSLLIDAGGQYAGYASDITRTYAADTHADFAALVATMEEMQQILCLDVRAGQSYPELHIEAHRLLGGVLAAHGLVRCSAEAAFAQGITRTFLPHGLGHLLGLQVHDIGGHQSTPEGGRTPPPLEHPYLRLTRTLEPGMVVTIEPGLYFIPMLLDALRATPAGSDVDWARVEAFLPCGGIRIEDDVLCTTDDPHNLTREAFAALA